MEVLITQDDRNFRWKVFQKPPLDLARLNANQKAILVKQLQTRCASCPFNGGECSTVKEINAGSELVTDKDKTVSVEFCYAVGEYAV